MNILMETTIRTRIIKIGNSQGIRIAKPLLEQSGISEDVDIEVQAGCLILRAASRPRAKWSEAFATMTAQGDDLLLDEMIATDWDVQEWEW